MVAIYVKDSSTSDLLANSYDDAILELQRKITALTNKLSGGILEQGPIEYTTRAWAPGDGGFHLTIPSDGAGLYYLCATFEAISGSAVSVQFQVHRNDVKIACNGITANPDNVWQGTMPTENVQTIVLLKKRDDIEPYIHKGTAGMVVRTYLQAVRLLG